MSGERSTQTSEECSNLSIFSSFGLFLQRVGQIKEYVILELHEMIRMPHAVEYAPGYILLSDQGRQGRSGQTYEDYPTCTAYNALIRWILLSNLKSFGS